MDPSSIPNRNNWPIDARKRRRMSHNANERYRRSMLNAQYDELARALPIICEYRRPSKRAIIEAALAWIYQTQLNEFRYREELSRLHMENARLMKAAQQHF